MPGLTPRAAKKTAVAVRKVARQPLDLTAPRQQTYPTTGKSNPPCLIRITDTGSGKKKTGRGAVMKVAIDKEDDEEAAPEQDVILTDTGKSVVFANPRDGYVQQGMLYFCFKISGIWCIDNQAVFQEFMD